MKLLTTLTFILLCFFASCGGESIGEIKVDGDSTPRFSIVGLSVGQFVVYRVPLEYLNKGIPMAETWKVNPNTMWMLDGTDAKEPISYGVVPTGSRAVAPAKPLEEGVVYFVCGYVSTRDTSAYVGQYFTIKNGRTQVYYGEGEEKANQ